MGFDSEIWPNNKFFNKPDPEIRASSFRTSGQISNFSVTRYLEFGLAEYPALGDIRLDNIWKPDIRYNTIFETKLADF